MILKVVFTLDIRWVLTDDSYPSILFTACAGGCLELGRWFIAKSSWLVMPLQ